MSAVCLSLTINLMRIAHLLFRHSNPQTMELHPRSGASVSQCVYFFFNSRFYAHGSISISQVLQKLLFRSRCLRGCCVLDHARWMGCIDSGDLMSMSMYA